MHYVARPASPPLAKAVEYLWASRGAPAHAQERVVPTGTLELVVNLVEDAGMIRDASGRERWFTGSVVSGAYRRPFTFDTRANASVIGAHIRSGFASLLLGVPASEVTDRHVDLESLWGQRALELREQLCAAPTTEQRFDILDRALAARLRTQRIHPAVAFALEGLIRPDARVARIAKHAELSQRRLIEVFTAAVGLTPKRFGRIARFHRASALARTSTFDWARVAHESGYYDQAHLIRDFRELADVAPSDLARVSKHVKEHHQLAVLER